MTNGRQAGAYPSLIPGNQEGARDAQKPWDVIELEGEEAHTSGVVGPSTSKEGRIMKVPAVKLQHDWWIRYHELTHVERPMWELGKNRLRNEVRQMLEEVALDGQCVLRDGIDLRLARDHFDWSKYGKPADVYQAVLVLFQIWASAQVSKDAGLGTLYQETWDLIRQEEAKEPKLAGLEDTVKEACDAVFNDYSAGNCEDWSDIVTAKLLGVPKEDLPNAPDPYTCGTPGTGGVGTGTGTGASSGDDDDEGTCAGSPGASDDSAESGDGDNDDGDADESEDGTGDDKDPCAACEGEGVDEDGNKCPACMGTGTASPGTDDAESGDQDAKGSATGTADSGEGTEDSDSEGAGFSEWDTPPIPVSKQRQNDPMDFGFDPLAKAQMRDPHDMPPLKREEMRARERITNEQLQEAIDQERVHRKEGEASLSEVITARTPFGAVDVHRHTLNQGTSLSVSLGWRSSEMGSTVRYPSQMFPSGRVFAKRAPGGSIILDCSGSMSWHVQHIMEAQKKMPNLYVAGYSYHASNGFWRASNGFVAPDTFIARYCVIAAKGKLDPDAMPLYGQEPEHTGGNSGADPASLYYAVRNAPQPWVWVSDGMVSFGESIKFYAQCDAIMRQHKIVRVLTIEDAIDYLLGKAVPGWHQCATVDTRWVRIGQAHMGRSVDPKTTMGEAGRWTRLRANSRRR